MLRRLIPVFSVFAALLVLAAPALARPAPQQTPNLTIYAAASLTDAFKEIGALYTQRTGWNVDFNFGASSTLRTQIEQGGVADVFASADTTQMNMLVQGGLNEGDPRVFAFNRLVLVMPKNNPAGITQLQDLAKPGVKYITANPDVPIAKYAGQALDKMSADPAFGSDVRTRVEANLVSREENVRAVLSKLSLGEADAGIVYVTDAQTTPDTVSTLDIPDQFNVIATYPQVLVHDGEHKDQGVLFMDLVLSSDGQTILAKRGFIPPPTGYSPVAPSLLAGLGIPMLAGRFS
jgi:molybdate transport system substrate-binding protein